MKVARELGRVLIIDDDAVVVVAVSDLLEEHGYRVFAQGSPIGATQLIVRERIDIAIIDVNMPEMQGDSVVRLFRTWDRLKDLPVVLLTGAESSQLEQLQRELPGIQVVRKSEMERTLVTTVDAVLRSAPARPVESASKSPKASPDLLQSYFEDLAIEMQLVRAVWSELLRRDISRAALANRSLDALYRRSQLLNLESVSQLLHALGAMVSTVGSGVSPPTRAAQVVEDAVTALSMLRTSRTRDFLASPVFLTRELLEIAGDLQAAARR